MQCLSWEGKYSRAQCEKNKLRKFDDSYIKYDVMEYSNSNILSVEALKLNRHVNNSSGACK